MKHRKNKRMIWPGWRFLLGLLLLVGTAFSQAGQSRIAPENATEARANELWPPARIMDVVGVVDGMTVAEIGAGRGRNVVHLADRVGPHGRVYAEDIDAEALRHLAERCRRVGFANVFAVLGDVSDPKLPPGALDSIVVIGSYQHFTDPVALMRNARAALKADGVVAIVDRFAGQDGPYSVSEGTMKAQMKNAGFVFKRLDKPFETGRGSVYLFRLQEP